MNMYNLPQEIEVWYIIPAVRRELAKLLTQKYGLSYDKAGGVLGITKAAIAQYNKNKRANKINLHPLVMKEVEKSAQRIAKDREKTMKEIIRILETGNTLGISRAIISQYQKNKRRTVKIKLHKKVIKEVEKSANLNSKEKEKTVKDILRILKFMRDKQLPFEICEDRLGEHEDCKEVAVTYEKYWE